MAFELPSISHRGLIKRPFADTYHHLLRLRWSALFMWVTLVFFTYNALFAVLYLAGGDCINAEDPDSLLLAFSFSVQTMSSTGYGAMSPNTPYAHVLTMIETFGGLLGTATVTGLIFAKFARPTSRIEFSNNCIIRDYDGVPTLQFRLSNQRTTQVVDAEMTVNALIHSVSNEGQTMTRLHTLKLVRDRTPAFRMSWTVIHPLDEDSPVASLADGILPENLTGIFATVVGLDEGFSQTVHAQAIYRPQAILFDTRFKDMMTGSLNEGLTIDHGMLHEVEPRS